MDNSDATASQSFEDVLFGRDDESEAEYEAMEVNEDVGENNSEEFDDDGDSESIGESSTRIIESTTETLFVDVAPSLVHGCYTENDQENGENYLSEEHMVFSCLDSERHERGRSRSPLFGLERPTKEPGTGRPRSKRVDCNTRRGRSRGGSGRRGTHFLVSNSNHSENSSRLVQVCSTDEDVPPILNMMVQDSACSEIQRDAQEQRRNQEGKDVEFYDADDGLDVALLRGDGRQFNWYPMDSFKGQREVFIPKKTGSVSYHPTIYDAFRSFWDDGILAEIVEETNRYAATISSTPFQANWYDTNADEILVLFAFWMMLSIHRMPTIKSCFSTNPLLKTDVFRSMFSSKRYEYLIRALHFANNEAKPQDAPRLYCFGRVLDHLNSKFQQNFTPAQNITIDESLTMWKGMLLFKQCIRTKVAQFGIKTFELCDSATGYLWSFMVYTGKDTKSSDTPIRKSTEVVISLMRPLLNKGYTLYLGTGFNSLGLARYLKSKRTDCVGTLRPTLKGIPPLLVHTELNRGQYVARHSGDVAVVAWQDKSRVITISTYHGVEEVSVSIGRGAPHNQQSKPKVLMDYNKNMGGVDRKDQMLEPYLMERKQCKKWYMKFFKRLLNCSILNSRILLESCTGNKVDHLACRLQLVDLILSNHHTKVSVTRPRAQSQSSVPSTSRFNASEMHWPVLIDGENAGPRRSRQRCVMCLSRNLKNSKTTFKCEQCDVALCVHPCFKHYHLYQL